MFIVQILYRLERASIANPVGVSSIYT
jgi:hypothetical protein